MSYTKVPSQDRALRYCRRILSNIKKCYIVWHSKGANLALFSAAHLSDDELSHVERIFLNDGPGSAVFYLFLQFLEFLTASSRSLALA